MKIYIASSWRNEVQPHLVRMLRGFDHEVYDFKNPGEGKTGFGWAQLGLGNPDLWTHLEYVEALRSARAQEGFKSDMDALRDCDACVLVQPCGNSAHLELGWAIGAGKLSAVLLEGSPKADLMLLAADKLFYSVNGDDGLIQWLIDTPIPCRAGKGWGPCRCKACGTDRYIDP